MCNQIDHSVSSRDRLVLKYAMHSRHLIAALTAILLAGCSHPAPTPRPIDTSWIPTEPQPGSLAYQVARPWRHVGSPVSQEQFTQDKNKCAMAAHQAPVGEGSPEVKFLAVFIACMRGAGYEPVP